MSLIRSISGIRGTIGGHPGTNLTPPDIVKYTAAYATMLRARSHRPRVVIGRDGRISGPMVQHLVTGTLIAMGVDVIDVGLSTTPTVEMAVPWAEADGGIILTASHNPAEWNALKLLNAAGEFLSAADGATLLELAGRDDSAFAPVDRLGTVVSGEGYLQRHIEAVCAHPLVDAAAIGAAGLRVVVDAINSSGAIAVPALLHALGVKDVVVLNGAPDGRFAHNPEPLPEHLTELSMAVPTHRAQLGIAVDPDVDRLCFVNEDGTLFGEEYTLVAVADYVLGHRTGATVSNLSSTRALGEVAMRHGGTYHPSAVGEVNVVRKMKEVQAVIGGEGNGGIILPDLHYGRDALIGIALFLSHLCRHGKGMRSLRAIYPDHVISKNKIELDAAADLDNLFRKVRERYHQHPVNTEDGLRIEFGADWVHLRASNTEPIIRIYAESDTAAGATTLAERVMADIRELS